MAGGNTKEKGRKSMAWASFGLALIGGAALVATFVGDILVSVLGIFPEWISVGLLILAIVLICRDVWLDGEPNFIALYSAMSLSVLAAAGTGKLGDKISEAGDRVLDQANQIAGEWLGTVSALGFAAIFILVALVLGQRTVTKATLSGGGGRR